MDLRAKAARDAACCELNLGLVATMPIVAQFALGLGGATMVNGFGAGVSGAVWVGGGGAGVGTPGAGGGTRIGGAVTGSPVGRGTADWLDPLIEKKITATKTNAARPMTHICHG